MEPVREISPADLSDFESIINLLDKLHLPISDVSLEDTYFLKAMVGGKLVGTAGIQVAGNVSLLRSMAVDPSAQSQGIGKHLLNQAVVYAQTQHVKEIYLITTTAEKYFKNKGFRVINRAETPESIKNTTQFSKTCAASAIVMRKKLNQ
jgi:N-acetylglutamate synthase-like GNAT family acetyltransferase